MLHPDVDSPFVDEVDVMNRLLPYHLFQQPKDDLEPMVSIKGKERAIDNEIQGTSNDSSSSPLLLTHSHEDTKFALQCYRRRQNIRDRWRQVLIKSTRVTEIDTIFFSSFALIIFSACFP